MRPEGGLVFRVWGKMIGERRDEARIGSIAVQESIVDVYGMWTAEHENQSIMLHRLVVSEV